MNKVQIESIVQELLTRWKISTAPIDVESLAEKIGIKVRGEDFGDDVSGVLIIEEGIGTVGYNRNHPPNRRRFTLAHEIGHFIIHDKSRSLFVDKSGPSFQVKFRNTKSSTGEIQEEREANAFAAALLMPKALLKKELGHILEKGSLQSDIDVIRSLAEKFEVSETAMSFRLNNLGYYIPDIH